ncbi:MAG TPA: glycine cleavage system protein GcvH [Acidiferrobacterales bacterium]|nr:glycine cleavage system protein GcvH [Acidiferrobacterales bacterium]
MSKAPADVKYTKSHEWVKPMPDGLVTVGITDHAQDLLGDMVFVDLPKVGAKVSAGKDCAVVESVKAASDVYAPVAGEIVEVNNALADAPEIVNKDPYGKGWLFRLKPDDRGEVDNLLDAAAYENLVASEKH